MIKEEIIRGEIVEVASKLFQQYGLFKTTMEDIAKAAGKGTAAATLSAAGQSFAMWISRIIFRQE